MRVAAGLAISIAPAALAVRIASRAVSMMARNRSLLICSEESVRDSRSRSPRSSASRAASAASERWRRSSWRTRSAVKAKTTKAAPPAAPIRRDRLASNSANRSLSDSPTPTISG